MMSRRTNLLHVVGLNALLGCVFTTLFAFSLIHLNGVALFNEPNPVIAWVETGMFSFAAVYLAWLYWHVFLRNLRAGGGEGSLRRGKD
ncbi:MAG: hypothetical protein NWE98_09645 [Candidatus Bathyarchaeota archaeon]|nr:hypothetical protein [Candidatus Bathyarchaeota archaeon]